MSPTSNPALWHISLTTVDSGTLAGVADGLRVNTALPSNATSDQSVITLPPRVAAVGEAYTIAWRPSAHRETPPKYSASGNGSVRAAIFQVANADTWLTLTRSPPLMG